MQADVAAIEDTAYQLVVLQEECAEYRARLQQAPPSVEPSSNEVRELAVLRERIRALSTRRDGLLAEIRQKEANYMTLQNRKNENAAACLALSDRRGRLLKLVAEMEEEKSKALAASLAPFPCELCGGDEHPLDDAFFLACCRRRVCREMTSGYVVAELGEGRLPVCCPFKNQKCIGQIPEQQLLDVLDEDAVRNLRRLQLRKLQEMDGMAFCRAADCNGMIMREDLGQLGTASTSKHHFVCTVNEEHQWCLQCDVIWHKDTTCEKYQEWKRNNDNADAEVDRLVQQMGWKRCPGCGNGVERVAGCNAMKCRCGVGFCYLCAFRAPKGDAHGHFNEPGPCHGKVWAH